MIDRKQKRFLSALAALMAKIAMADGVLASEEVVSVRMMWTRLGLTSEHQAYCQRAFELASRDDVPLETYAREYVATSYGDSTRAFIYELLWELACSDGVFHRKEADALRLLAKALSIRAGAYNIYYSKFLSSGGKVVDEELEERRRIAEAEERERAERRRREEMERRQREEAERVRKAEEEAKRKAEEAERRRRERERREREEARRFAASRSPLDRAYAILGCTRLDSDTKLRRAYRILALKNHPDHLCQDGVSEELIALANARMAEINDAWDLIRRSRMI